VRQNRKKRPVAPRHGVADDELVLVAIVEIEVNQRPDLRL